MNPYRCAPTDGEIAARMRREDRWCAVALVIIVLAILALGCFAVWTAHGDGVAP